MKILIEESVLRQALDNFEAILCDPEGNVCINRSDGDRAVLDEAITALRTAFHAAIAEGEK